MYKRALFGIICFALLTVLFTACTVRDQASIPVGPSAKMGPSTFIDQTVTLKKGDSLTLIDTVAVPHIISNGSWDGSSPKPAQEAGAPKVNLSFAGSDSQTAGPFTTAGTFKLYCTIHPGMNLTVIVQ